MACQPPDASDYSRGLDKRQLIFEFDMDVWQVSTRPRKDAALLHPRAPLSLSVTHDSPPQPTQGLIKEYDIQESIIPPRKHKQRNKGAKWYV